MLTTRKDWYDKPGALPDDVIAAIRKRFDIGWWSISLRFYGYEGVNEAAAVSRPGAVREEDPRRPSR